MAVSWWLLGAGALALVLGAFAVVFLLTSFVAWCPAYAPFGISTCKRAPRPGSAG